MPEIIKTAHYPYSCQDMFALVADVDSYVDFVPSCSESQILEYQGEDQCYARLVFTKWGLRVAFITMNKHFPHRCINMNLVEGRGFRYLRGEWLFKKEERGSSIQLRCDYEMLGGLHRLLSVDDIWQSVFEHIRLRARSVYGER